MTTTYDASMSSFGAVDRTLLKVVAFPAGETTQILPAPSAQQESVFVVSLNHIASNLASRRNDRDKAHEIEIHVSRDKEAATQLDGSEHRSRVVIYSSEDNVDVLFGRTRQDWNPSGDVFSQVSALNIRGAAALPEVRSRFFEIAPLKHLYADVRWRNTDRWLGALPKTLVSVWLEFTQLDPSEVDDVAHQIGMFARMDPDFQFPERHRKNFRLPLIVNASEALENVFFLPNLVQLVLRARRLRNSVISLRPLGYPYQMAPERRVFLASVAENLTTLSLQAETLDAPEDLFADLRNLKTYVGALPHPMGNYMSCQATLENLRITHSKSVYDTPVHIETFTALRKFQRLWPNAQQRRDLETRAYTLTPNGRGAFQLAWPVQMRRMTEQLGEPPTSRDLFSTQPQVDSGFTLDRTTSKAVALLYHIGITSPEIIYLALDSAFPISTSTSSATLEAVTHQLIATRLS